MALYDTTRPIDEILSRLQGVRRGAEEGSYTALCPAHDDHSQSLSISEGNDGRVLLKCFRGCDTRSIVSAIGLEMKDLFVREKKPATSARASSSHRPQLTVDELGNDKGLPVSFLKNCGVEQGIGGVKIAYKLPDGSPAPRQRWRRALSAKEGSSWLKGKGSPVAYGLWMLNGMRRKSESLVLVEGESDSWTLWYHGFPALGIPGADMAKTLEPNYVEPFEKVYIYREPDEGGNTFVTGLAKRLAQLNYQGEVYVIEAFGGYKDPNDLHKAHVDDPEKFREIFSQMMAASEQVELSRVDIADTGATTPATATAPEYGLTDLGNARRLVRSHGHDLRYCYPWDRWVWWNGKHWEFDTSGEIFRRAKSTVATIYAEAAEHASDREREQVAKHAIRSESSARIKAMVDLAQSEPGIPVDPDAFDVDPWLLNTENGILDLRTFELLPHSRENLMMKIVPVEYDPDAKCPRWLKFLNDIMAGNQDLVDYLQRVVGYALTGDTREQCLFLLYGTGANGKSTFLETLKTLFGEYGQQADFSTFLHSDQDRVRNDIARLLGKRYVAAIEAGAGRRLAEVLVKQLTGGDTVSARFLYKEYFEYKPTFKIFLAANSKPAIYGQDKGIWRRIRLIPFTVTIPEPEQDKDLPLKLQEELPGILAWAVEGCKKWQEMGLADPREVVAATDKYKAQMDILGEFIQERCILADTAQATSSALYKEYVAWCEDNSERPLAHKTFSMRLEEKGFERTRTSRARGWLGIGLLDDRRNDLGLAVGEGGDSSSGVAGSGELENESLYKKGEREDDVPF